MSKNVSEASRDSERIIDMVAGFLCHGMNYRLRLFVVPPHVQLREQRHACGAQMFPFRIILKTVQYVLGERHDSLQVRTG